MDNTHGPTYVLKEVNATIYSYQKITVIDCNVHVVYAEAASLATNCLTDAYEYTCAQCLIDHCELALSARSFLKKILELHKYSSDRGPLRPMRLLAETNETP